MRVAHVNLLPAPRGLGIDEVLECWPSLPDIAEVAAHGGVRVSVLQAAWQAGRSTRNGIDYHFVDISGTVATSWRARRFARALAEIGAEVLHAHSLGFIEDVYAISRCLSPALPVLIQDHADRLPRWWRRHGLRRRYSIASGIAFTSIDLARPFIEAGLLGPLTRLFEIPESSSRFTPGDRAGARTDTGLHGNPCVLSIGHLSRGKDPLSVLDGIALAARRLPDLHLWCVFGSAPMMPAVQARIERDPRLRECVHLLGRVPHARIETLLRASDLFVSGSHSEGSGYAAIEAIACGITPVLTDIPAFRALTGEGRIGHLWPRGNPERLAEALCGAVENGCSRQRVRAHFDATLSFSAVGRRWADAYAQLLEDRWRRAA